MRRPMRPAGGPPRGRWEPGRGGRRGTPPVVIDGAALRGAAVSIPVASAQVRTAVALAALQAEGATTIDSPPGFRDHTERWLEAWAWAPRLATTVFRVLPGPVPPVRRRPPRRPLVGGLPAGRRPPSGPGRSPVRGRVPQPGHAPGFLDVLAAMGARVDVAPTGEVLGDPVGDVIVVGGLLHGITDRGSPRGARPRRAAAGRRARPLSPTGETVVADAGELRVKESDRIAVDGRASIRALGGQCRATAGRLRRWTGTGLRPGEW